MPPLTANQAQHMDFTKIHKVRPLDLVKLGWQAEALYYILRRDCTTCGVFATFGLDPAAAVASRYPEWPESLITEAIPKLLQQYLEINDDGDIEIVNYLETETVRKSEKVRSSRRRAANKQESFIDPIQDRTSSEDIDSVFDASEAAIKAYNEVFFDDVLPTPKKDKWNRSEVSKAIRTYGLGKTTLAVRNLVLSDWHAKRKLFAPRFGCNQVDNMLALCKSERTEDFLAELKLKAPHKIDYEGI